MKCRPYVFNEFGTIMGRTICEKDNEKQSYMIFKVSQIVHDVPMIMLIKIEDYWRIGSRSDDTKELIEKILYDCESFEITNKKLLDDYLFTNGDFCGMLDEEY